MMDIQSTVATLQQSVLALSGIVKTSEKRDEQWQRYQKKLEGYQTANEEEFTAIRRGLADVTEKAYDLWNDWSPPEGAGTSSSASADELDHACLLPPAAAGGAHPSMSRWPLGDRPPDEAGAPQHGVGQAAGGPNPKRSPSQAVSAAGAESRVALPPVFLGRP